MIRRMTVWSHDKRPFWKQTRSRSILPACNRELNDLEENPFIGGEKHAYVESLEIIQDIWDQSRQNGLDFDIEDSFPLI